MSKTNRSQDVYNAFRQIANSQTLKGQLFQIGTGFVPSEIKEEPARILHSRPVWHSSKNEFPFGDLAFNNDRARKIGEFYDPDALPGSPSCGGEIKCYLQKVQGSWWLLWADTWLDAYYFDEPFRQTLSPSPIAWCRVEKGDTRASAALILLHALILQIARCDDDEFYFDGFMAHGKYDIFRNHYYRDHEFIVASVYHSVHKNAEELQRCLALCPPVLREHFLHQAVIKPDAKDYEFFDIDCFKMINPDVRHL